MNNLTHLIDLLATQLETVPKRRAVLRQALGVKSPLLNHITWEGSPREFTVNMLAVLARDLDALDALIAIAKEPVGGNVADEIERLRPALNAWLSAGADARELSFTLSSGSSANSVKIRSS